MKTPILDITLMWISAVLAGDLLYLYFVNAWYDPNQFIEKSELVLLVSFILLTLVRIIKKMKEIK